MIANDRLEGERQHAKNAVEEYVYEIRDKLYGEYEQYISDAVSHEVLSSINTLMKTCAFPLMENLLKI